MDYQQTLIKIVGNAYDNIYHMKEEDLDFKQSPSKWSKKEILGHLIDSAYNNHQRLIRAENQGNLIFQGYDQDEWVRINAYQNRNIKDILNLWKNVNLHLSDVINGLSDALLSTAYTVHNFHDICLNPLLGNEPASIAYLIWDYLEHLEYHLAQIILAYQKLNPDKFPGNYSGQISNNGE